MSNSHLGQEIGNHVTLWGYTTGQDKLGSPIWKFGRIYPDGVVDSSAFNVPEGKALVVTDVDWNYNTGEHNETQIFSMYMKMPKKNIRNKVFASTVLGDTSGSSGASVSMTTGFVVSKMNIMEPRLEFRGVLNDVILRGYLIEVPETKKKTIKIKGRKHK